MPENINWNGVIQSITDFWLPLLGWIIGIILVIAIVFIVKKIKKKKIYTLCSRKSLVEQFHRLSMRP